MLKSIPVSDVCLGMYIHRLQGNWFSHPFWRRKFVLTDARTLAVLRDSTVRTVVIDVSRGKDVAPARVRTSESEAEAPAARLRQRRPRAAMPPQDNPTDLRSTARLGMRREFGNAKSIAERSQKIVSRVFLKARLGKAIRSDAVAPVIEDIFASIQRNPHAFNGLMRCRQGGAGLYRHSLAVSALMIALGCHLKLSPDTIREAGMVGLLKDIGLPLLESEAAALAQDYVDYDNDPACRHALLGHDQLRLAGDIPDSVLDACLHHHERLDGSGLPHALAGEQVSLLARMAAICDIYDDLVSPHHGRNALDPATAIAQMNSAVPGLDGALFRQFVETVGFYPIGAVVRLRSERLALVVDQDHADHSRPRVRVFWSIAQRRKVPAEDIALSRCFGQDEIVGVGDPTAAGISDFARLRERLFAGACMADPR